MLRYWGTTWEPPTGELERLNAMLQQEWPRSERAIWLLAYWEPGEFWLPGRERIVVAAMHPRKWYEMEDHFWRANGYGSDESKLAELNGPNPRRGAEYQSHDKVPALTRYLYPHGRLVYPSDGRLPATISERQWLLWRSHGALAVPIWVVQGHEGGHPLQLTRMEIAMAQAKGLGTVRAPEVGSLPFAGGDRRVVDRLRAWQEMQALSKEVRENWFRIDEEHRTEPERKLHALFDQWYDDGVENRLNPSAFAHSAFA